jgi:hypothetical protein
MSEPHRDDKQAKREARQLWEEARTASNSGDYHRARQLQRAILGMAAGGELEEKARAELDNLRPHRLVLIAGIGATLLYLVAWWVSLSQ